MHTTFTLVLRLLFLVFLSGMIMSCQTAVEPVGDVQAISLVRETTHHQQLASPVRSSFERFLMLCQTGKPIPHGLIFEHTMLTNPVGDFYATEVRPIDHQIEGILLVQLTQQCQRTYLLTTDRDHIIDQALIAENCPNESETTRSTFYWQGDRRIVRTFMKSVAEPRDLPRITYRIAPSGGIELVKATNR